MAIIFVFVAKITTFMWENNIHFRLYSYGKLLTDGVRCHGRCSVKIIKAYMQLTLTLRKNSCALTNI